MLQDPILINAHERILYELGEIKPIIPYPAEMYFERLVKSIVGQQLSTKAAASIFSKVQDLFQGNILPAEINQTEMSKLRQAGLSTAKASYILNLAEAWLHKTVMYEEFAAMKDAEIISELTKIKGIGKWTAEMFLMFTMGRPDVFSSGDFGLRKAICNLYDIDPKSNFRVFEEFSERWKPERTLASRILWQSLELGIDSQ